MDARQGPVSPGESGLPVGAVTGTGSLKAVVFDWDLTLWNSWDIHVWLLGQTAQALGLPRPEPASIASHHSLPFHQHFACFFPAEPQRALDTYLKLYREALPRMAYLFPGIRETLHALKAKGYRLAVFSDKRPVFGLPELELTGIGHLLDYVLFQADGRPYKPDPQGLLQVLKALKVRPGEALYVGDSHEDVACARRAGVTSAAALWASVNREMVLAQGPNYCWERVDQVLTTVGPGEPLTPS